jgi:hypothetical protein
MAVFGGFRPSAFGFFHPCLDTLRLLPYIHIVQIAPRDEADPDRIGGSAIKK